MVLFLILLYASVLSYIGLMVLVIIGMLRPQPARRSALRPPVSVIIPAHNEEAKLDATLASLSRQEYPGEAQFIIVNDRSTDATAQIIAKWEARDARFSSVHLTEASRRLSPKVNAVNEGILRSRGEIIVTSDADCDYPSGWLAGMVSHFVDGVVMVVGYVESTREGRSPSPVATFESVDWLTLMLTSRSLTRFGWKFASSANNQAYRRDAFEQAGGFGLGGRAPSGDEDLLTQRLGRLPGARIVFADAPEVRVLTRPMPSLRALLRQRKRWVSRYHHVMHYHPAFMASIATLGLQSVLLSAAVLLAVLVPAYLPYVAVLWGVKLGVEMAGLRVGTKQLGRQDLWGIPSIVWALLHPFFIATVVVWSFISPGDWRNGEKDYRRAYWQRVRRMGNRQLRDTLLRKGRASGSS